MNSIHNKILKRTTVHTKDLDKSVEETREEWVEIEETTYDIARVNINENLRNIDFDNCEESDDEYVPDASKGEDSILITPPTPYKKS